VELASLNASSLNDAFNYDADVPSSIPCKEAKTKIKKRRIQCFTDHFLVAGIFSFV